MLARVAARSLRSYGTPVQNLIPHTFSRSYAKHNKARRPNDDRPQPNHVPTYRPTAQTEFQKEQTSRPLPDLTRGIPSTLDHEIAEAASAARTDSKELKVPEDHSQSAGGRGGADLPKMEYISSIERRKSRVAKYMYASFLGMSIIGTIYLGRNWETEAEERAHLDAPSGWGFGLFYNRAGARLRDILDYYNEPSFTKLLPDPDPAWARPYTLVLSLEDLMIHSEWTREHGWRMAKRPGVDYFLRYLNQYYELVIFTSVPSMIGEPIIRKLDPFRVVLWPLFREATRFKKGQYIKDLSFLNRDLSKVIMIDTVAAHANMQPENAIILPKWKGDLQDKDLVSLIPFLEYIAIMEFDDTRTVLKSFEGKHIPTEFAHREAIARERFQKELAEEQAKRPRRSGVGLLGSALGIKPMTAGFDGMDPGFSRGFDEGKTYQDIARERGQANYELFDKEIRENGEKWLQEAEQEEKKMKGEAMNSWKSSILGPFGSRREGSTTKYNELMDDEMAASPPGSWPDKLQRIEKLNSLEPIQPGSQAVNHHGHGAEVDETLPRKKGAAERIAKLPREILEQILYLADPPSFASLALVSHDWRAASQTSHLYAHQLSSCPSFSINGNVVAGPFDDDSLPQLRKQFVQEVKRNLFEAYLRPNRMVIKLISTTNSSAAAFPGGEAFDFTFSPNGHWVLALCSSRIYVLDTVSPKVSVRRELKVPRRPVSAAILDDGSVLAVLSNVHQVNVYDLSNHKVKHLRAVALDNQSTTIAMSPQGEVLAAAYAGGIEVHSLAEGLSTDRRSVKCDSVDSLAFSSDGTMLFGTTQNSKNPYTVVLSAPFYNETNHELPPTDILGQMWTSQILFPNSSRDCSHATLLPHHTEGDASWTFTYDRVFESFRAVRTDDLRNGTTIFTGPKALRRAGSRSARKRLLPCTLPSTSDRGELGAAGFLGKEIWLYGVPESLDNSALLQSDGPRSEASGSSATSNRGKNPRSPAKSLTSDEAAELMRLPHWQVLVDKNRNVFAKGHRVAEVSGVSSIRWVSRKHESPGARSIAQRLIIAAPGGVSGRSGLEQDEFAIVDGGRLVILDFDRRIVDGKHEEIVLEVGNSPPEILEEENIDMDTEVALVRQRTVRQRKDGPLGSSVADVLALVTDLPPPPPIPALRLSSSSAGNEPTSNTDETLAQRSQAPPHDGLSLEEASAVFDGPYSHTHPRSRTSLYRSATAVAANRQRNPPRILSEGRVEYRRADGRGELPHESDADNWVPPPPPYTPDADRPLPEHLRMSLMPRQLVPMGRAVQDSESLRRASTMAGTSSPTSPSQRISFLPSRTRNPSATSSQIPELDETSIETRPPPAEESWPLRSIAIPHGAVPREQSISTSPPPNRRRASAYAGRFTSSSDRLMTHSVTPPMPPIPAPLVPRKRVAGHAKSVSLPSSPVTEEFSSPDSALSLSGANLQQRLDYPLPPAPNRISTSPSLPTTPTQSSRTGPTPEPLTTTVQADQEVGLIASNMPSAQQLANLHNRYSHPPSPTTSSPVGRPSPTTTTTTPGPPRGALGAAGSPSLAADRRRLLITQRSEFTASSPALLRPTPRRLDTIQSISSVVTEEGRGRSVDGIGDRMTIRGHRRSRSLGAVAGGREVRKGWWVGKRRRGRERDWDGTGEESEREGGKGAKCVIM
ncbi:hypothetical protein MMC07_001695 [Pseudocyphellaria aurata]|nr:hypothetical protein [Pseudocyphellaria aurata]